MVGHPAILNASLHRSSARFLSICLDTNDFSPVILFTQANYLRPVEVCPRKEHIKKGNRYSIPCWCVLEPPSPKARSHLLETFQEGAALLHQDLTGRHREPSSMCHNPCFLSARFFLSFLAPQDLPSPATFSDLPGLVIPRTREHLHELFADS
jgi:hypothetical protein